MANIAMRTEKEVDYRGLADEIYSETRDSRTPADAVCFAGCELSHEVDSKYIAGFSLSGSTIKKLSNYRPPKPILGMSPSEKYLEEHRYSGVFTESGLSMLNLPMHF